MTTVWVENPEDAGSSVWGCSSCQAGAWCASPALAHEEATRHARGHGVPVVLLERRNGPRPDETRDARIVNLRRTGATVRAIAANVGMSHSGVVRVLRRLAERAAAS